MARKEPVFETVNSGPLIKKTEGCAVRMSLITIDGVERIDLREFYRTKDSTEWKPTGKGFTLLVSLATKVLKKFYKFSQELEAQNG